MIARNNNINHSNEVYRCPELALKYNYFTVDPTAQAAIIVSERQWSIFLSIDEQGPDWVRSTPSNVSHK